MKELNDYVEHRDLDLTDRLLDELGWVRENVHHIVDWFIGAILLVVLVWGIF